MVPAVETRRANADLSPENRQALFAHWAGAYKAYAGLLVAAGQREEAFRLAELSKARTLLESTAIRRANQWELLTAAERTSIQGFETRITKFNNAIAGASQWPDQKLAIEADKNRVLVGFSAFRRDLARKYPKYAQLSDVKSVDASEGLAVVPDDALFVSYLLDGDRPIVFTMSRQDFYARLLDEIPKLANTAEAYRRLISAPGGAKDLAAAGLGVWRLADGSYLVASKTPGPGASQVDDAGEIARHLGQLLLAPISERPRGRKRIIISADSALALVPFEALEVGGRMLIVDHDVSYAQSLSMLALLKSRDEEYRRRTERKDLLVMGNAIYETASAAPAAWSGTTNVGRSADRSGLDIGKMVIRSARSARRSADVRKLEVQMDQSAGTETEVVNVAGLFAKERSVVFTQRDATEAKLLELNKR